MATVSKFPENIKCVNCGGEMPCIRHEPQPIADQVKRIYRCPGCQNQLVKYFDVFD